LLIIEMMQYTLIMKRKIIKIISSLNSLVNGTRNILSEMKHKFYLYQKLNYIFIENQILSL